MPTINFDFKPDDVVYVVNSTCNSVAKGTVIQVEIYNYYSLEEQDRVEQLDVYYRIQFDNLNVVLTAWDKVFATIEEALALIATNVE